MRVIVSHTEDRWRYWLKLEGCRVFSGKTREAIPIDLRKIKWTASSMKKVQKLHAGLYAKLVRAKTELDRHLPEEGTSTARPAPLTLAWEDWQ